jgi:hypothetical protein
MMSTTGFDHGAGHPLLFLDDAKPPNCQKNNGFNDLGNYSEWPKVAGAVIQAGIRIFDVVGNVGRRVRHRRIVSVTAFQSRGLTRRVNAPGGDKPEIPTG